MDSLRYYIAHNGGLKVMKGQPGGLATMGEFFPGKTLEHLIGCRSKPEVVFAAVAFDGGYRTELLHRAQWRIESHEGAARWIGHHR